METEEFELTICTGAIGLIFIILYAFFAYYVTHHGYFYQIRRWKFAILINTILLGAFFGIFCIWMIYSNAGNSTEDLFNGLWKSIPAFLTLVVCFIPMLFLSIIGTYNSLKWMDGDRFLEKIWKTPPGQEKGPIEYM